MGILQLCRHDHTSFILCLFLPPRISSYMYTDSHLPCMYTVPLAVSICAFLLFVIKYKCYQPSNLKHSESFPFLSFLKLSADNLLSPTFVLYIILPAFPVSPRLFLVLAFIYLIIGN